MKRFIVGLLTLSILVSSTVIPVHAQTEITEDDSAYTISGEEGDSAVQDVDVNVSKGSSFKVCVPKNIVLQPNVSTVYSVGVYADISSTQKIVVEPLDGYDEEDGSINFILENEVNSGVKAKDSVKATVTPLKTVWSYNDTDLIADVDNIYNPQYQTEAGAINASISAGVWSGKFKLRISLEDV